VGKRGGLAVLLWSCLLPCFLASFFLFPGEPALLVPSEAEGPTLTLALVGDVMLGRGVAQALDGDWVAAFAEVRPWLAEADGSTEFAEVLAFANLESPLTTVPFFPPASIWGGEGGAYDLRASPEAVVALEDAGFDVVSLANNHALDAGGAGVCETMNTLRAAGIVPLVNWETGTSPGWSPAYQSSNYQSTNLSIHQVLAFDDSVTPLDVGAAVEAVAAAAEQADLVWVSIHWGGEYQAAPSSRQRAIARALAGAGARLIVGHGPHVLQRVEWVGETLVAYSLGNFLFDQPYPADCRWGAILRVTLRGGRIVAIEAVPTVVERGRVVPAGPDAAAAILARLNLQL
jgi:hypothetical protein